MKTKILIIQHESDDKLFIHDELKKGDINCITEIVETKKEYTNALVNFKPDIILSNYTFPDFDGHAVLKIREELVPQTPFIFVSETLDHENTEGITAIVLKNRLHTLIDKIKLALKEAELHKINGLLKQSEEKRTQELSQLESKYKSLVESSMDAILQALQDGSILTANAAACEIFKMTEEELFSAKKSDIIDCTDSRFQLLVEERDRTGRAKAELTFKRKDGSTFPGEITSVAFTDTKGQEIVSMSIRDITERRQAELALKASESFSKGILDSLTSHIAVIDSNGTILKVNQSWNTFAQNNGGNSTAIYGQGANYFDACESKNESSDAHAAKAINGIKDVLNGVINEFYLEYPCHSPETERWFNMRVKTFESSESLLLIEHQDITERKMSEQKLSVTTDALTVALNERNTILNSSLDVICSFDKDGKFVSVSAASERIWGYSPDELIGKNYIDFVFSEDVIKTLDTDETIQSGITCTMFENRYVHKDGHIIPMLWSSRWDEIDQMSYSVGKDATVKKRLEKAFEIERQRFMDLYSQAPSSMGILKGPNHVYEMANPLYLKLIDKKEDIIGKTVKEVLPEMEAQGILDILDSVFQTGETFSANEMLVKFDPNNNRELVDTYLNFIYQAHKNVDGTIDGIFFFVNDVTEQVVSRKKIEESYLRYTSIIDQASDAICFIDSSLKFIEANHYACHKLGYTKAEIFQLSIADLFVKEDLQENPIQFAKLKEGETFRGERRIITKDGSIINIEISARKLINGNIILFARDTTEKKKAERALAESEKKYRQIVETAQEGIWLLDENNKTNFVNSKMCQILEYTRREMMGKEIYSFMDEEGKQIAAKLAERKKEGKPDKKYFKYIAKSGKEIWANITSNPLFDDSGVYKGSLAMVTDITEFKKAQQTLQRNEKKYRYLFENNPMPMWITELDTFNFLDVNQMAIEQYGYSREEFLSMTALQIRPEQEKFNKSFEAEPKKFNRGIWNHRKKDGTIIQVEVIAHKIIYEGVWARFILANDITERIKAEQTLQENEKKYRYLFNNNPMPMWIIDEKTTKFLDVNEMAILRYGYSREEFLSMSAVDIRPEEEKERFNHFRNSSDNNETNYFRGIWNHIKKDGTVIPVEIIAHKIIYEGVPARFILSNDITERRKAELSLEQQNKELLKANSELDRFVYSVSHDLRSPLTSILGILSLIEGESQEEDTLKHAEMIHKSIDRLDEFIKNILKYSRNNRTGLEIEKISVQETIFEIVQSLQSMKEAKEIQYEIDIQEHHPFYSDSLRFNMILENLISNAIKHHKKSKSGRYIKITGHSDHEKLQFRVEDNGIGIAPENHHKIFDMFYRISSNTDGTGIGLYIVKDAVEKIQGTLEVHSEKEIGTTFIINLKNLKP